MIYQIILNIMLVYLAFNKQLLIYYRSVSSITHGALQVSSLFFLDVHGHIAANMWPML